MALEWNDPYNHAFAICLLKRNARRTDKCHLKITYQWGQNYQNVGADPFGFGDSWSKPFAYNFSMWQAGRVPAGDGPDAEVAGPALQFIPGGAFWDLNAVQSYHPLDYNFRTELINAKKVPEETTITEICDSLRTQTTQTIPNLFPRGDGAFGDYYSDGFVFWVDQRKKLVFESEPMIQPPLNYQLVWGRLPPVFNPGINDLAYEPGVWWTEPTLTGYKAYKLPCKAGCCCCCC